jgi:hypothetical protein
MTIQQDQPPEDEVTKRRNLGNRTDRRNRAGRPGGVTTARIRELNEALERFGYDPPHISLLKLGNDNKLELPMRAQALALAAPYFAPKLAPAHVPRFLADAPDLGRLTDAASAVVFVASVVESARTGKLDAEWTRLFLDAADVFVRLHAKLNLESEVEKHRELALAAE